MDLSPHRVQPARPAAAPGHPDLIFTVECEDGSRLIVYNAALLGNPTDHVPDKWYIRPYPTLPPGEGAVGPFDAAEEAERAVRARHARVGAAPRTS